VAPVAQPLPTRRALIGLGFALLALATCWLPFAAVPAGAIGIVFAASARQEGDGEGPRVASAALLIGAVAVAVGLALAIVGLG
jgi:hypothetical protein